jgi:hypothetical protein
MPVRVVTLSGHLRVGVSDGWDRKRGPLPGAGGVVKGVRAPPSLAGPVPVVWCGGVLLSHTLPGAVPSALRVLASGFGMGPGVSPALWPPQPWSPARPGAVGWSAVDSRAAVVFGCPVPAGLLVGNRIVDACMQGVFVVRLSAY